MKTPNFQFPQEKRLTKFFKFVWIEKQNILELKPTIFNVFGFADLQATCHLSRLQVATQPNPGATTVKETSH